MLTRVRISRRDRARCFAAPRTPPGMYPGLARALRTIDRGIRNAGKRLKPWAGCADSPLGVTRLRLLRAMRPRVRGEAGYTMIELIVVMAIMGIVLAALTTSLRSGRERREAGRSGGPRPRGTREPPSTACGWTSTARVLRLRRRRTRTEGSRSR